jgi:hypothetical protein
MHLPSAALNVEVSVDQMKLLQPTLADVTMGSIIDQCMGEKAVKKLAKRRINMVDSNVELYSRILNDGPRLEHIAETNKIAAMLGELEAERVAKRDKKVAERKAMQEEKKRKKDADHEKGNAKQDELYPGLCIG